MEDTPKTPKPRIVINSTRVLKISLIYLNKKVLEIIFNLKPEIITMGGLKSKEQGISVQTI